MRVGWKEASVRDVCQKTALWNPKTEPRGDFFYIDVSSVSNDAFAITTPQAITGLAAPGRARKTVRSRDVIYATIRPTLKRVALVPPKYDNHIASTAYCVVRANREKAVPEFLYFVLLSDPVSKSIADAQHGASYPAVTDKDILGQVVPLPPLGEQKKIAAVLLRIQRAIGTQQKIIQSLRDLKRSTMQHLFTHGLRSEKTKMTEIGEIPESWEVVPLEQMGRIGNGSTPKRTNQGYWDDGTIPWLTSGKIHEGRIKEPDQFVTPTAKTECHLPTLREGGVLIAITEQGKTLGNAAIVSFDSTMSQHLAYVQPENAGMHPPYVWQYLATQYSALRRIGSGGGSTKGALTCAALREYPVPLPETVDEQREIAYTLQLLDDKTATHQSKKTALQDLFKTTLNKLVTGDIGVVGLDIEVEEVE